MSCVTNLCAFCRPSTTFLAGKKFVYKGIPKQVIAVAFNVDEDTLREPSKDEEVIFRAQRADQGKHNDLATTKKEQDQQHGGGEREQEQQQKCREQEEHCKREEDEQRHRREEEERRIRFPMWHCACAYLV